MYYCNNATKAGPGWGLHSHCTTVAFLGIRLMVRLLGCVIENPDHAEAFYFDEVPFVYFFLYVPCFRGHVCEDVAAWDV